MTGRRAMGGWDQRLSRALQFKPGHVGGRVASAQPVQRTGGTLRRPSIGSAYSPLTPITVRPDLIGPWFGGDALVAGTYVGSGGQSTLADDSDSTYMLVDQGLGTHVGDARQVAFAFEAGDLTGWSAIASCTLRLRVKSPDSTSLYVSINGNTVRTPGSGLPYYYAPDYATLTTSWAEYSFEWTTGGGDWSDGVLPSIAVVEAGTVEVLVNVNQSPTYTGDIAHLAEAWLDVFPG